MTSEQAIGIVQRYCPCPHDEYAQPLGLGDRHRCEQCGAMFDPTTPEFYAKRTQAFDESVEHLRALARRVDELEACLRWYVEEDDVNEGNPSNGYWIRGKQRAKRALGLEVE